MIFTSKLLSAKFIVDMIKYGKCQRDEISTNHIVVNFGNREFDITLTNTGEIGIEIKIKDVIIKRPISKNDWALIKDAIEGCFYN